jgi:phosphoglucomutase
MDQGQLRERAGAYIAEEGDRDFRAEVEKLLAAGDWKELEDRFYTDLEFGTGGLRGVIGGGSNRMNSLVVRKATQGLASYLKKALPGKPLAAAIAYDSRNYSASFAMSAALVLAGNGVKVYLFSSLRPTPELSFAVRELGCDTGIVVTASHNPPAYNGYKAYWGDGAQVIEPHDEGIIAEVQAVKAVRAIDEKEALAKGLLVMIDRDIDAAYQAMVKSKLFRPKLIAEKAKDVKIVYTPLHGTGALHFEAVMKDLGLNVITVPEQREGNGAFPTVSFPNPEEAAALKMAIDLGKKEKADVVMATDPDADRLGIAVPDGKGDFVLITGNQLGSLLMDYILLSRTELGTMPKKAAVVKSIVTTSLQDGIARKYGAELCECLTGFKWIADLMRRFETDGSGRSYVFGSEESYGFLVETEVRDKDGISAAAMTAEMTLYWRSKGKSLLDRMGELYSEHGYYAELSISKYFKGAEGMETMKGLMAGHRDKPFTALGGLKVSHVRDFKLGSEWDSAAPDTKKKLAFPASNVIQWFLEDGSWVTARPSGTEPKIKYYACVRADAAVSLEEAKRQAGAKVKGIEGDIRSVIGA